MQNSGLFIFLPMTKYLLFIFLFPILVFSQGINPKKEIIFQDLVTSLQTPDEVTNLNLRGNNLFEMPLSHYMQVQFYFHEVRQLNLLQPNDLTFVFQNS